MTSKIDTNWHQNYDALKSYILERGHLPDKRVVENRSLLSWAKYQRKKIKEGSLDEEKRELFESLLATRSTEHTGGRRKKTLLCIYIRINNTYVSKNYNTSRCWFHS